jgi:hypothetical protein
MHLHVIVKVDAFASTDFDPVHGRATIPPVMGIGYHNITP